MAVLKAHLLRACGAYGMAMSCTVGLQRGRANCFWNVHKRLGMESISPWPYASSSKARLREVSQKVRRAWPDRKPGLPLAFSVASFVVPHGASDTLVHSELFLTTRPSSKGVLIKQHFLFKEITGYYENNVDSLCKAERITTLCNGRLKPPPDDTFNCIYTLSTLLPSLFQAS